MIEFFAVMVKGRWRLGIGDPSLLGWVTTIGYFVAAGLCVAYALRSRKTFSEDCVVHRPSSFRPSASFFWWSLAVFMLLMGFNKQLDLQNLILEVSRRMSVEQGWFAERDAVRKWILLGFGLAFSILLIWMGWKARGAWRRYVLPASGIALLVLFVLIRASGHRLEILGYRPGSFSKYKVLEIGGIVCVTASALLELRRSSKQTH
jgi:hypothetical protein